MIKILKYFVCFFFILFFGLNLLGYGYIIRGLKSTYFRLEKSAQVDDAKFFYNDTIKKSNEPFYWPKSINYNKKNISKKLRNTLEEYKTHSFLVIKKDSLVYEEYWDKWSVENNKSNSFSMAKSIVSLIAGIAVDKGYLSGFDQSVKSVFPEMNFFTDGPDITIGDLLNMSSGLDWNENYYNPFNVTARSYMTKDLPSLIFNLSFNKEPGLNYDYQSGATQLASLMLEKVLLDSSGITFSEFSSNNFWKKIGATEDAFWSLDKKGGVVKSFCCFHSNARDFAKIGRLFLNNGKISENNIVLNEWYFNKVLKPNIIDFYSYGWWKGKSLDTPIYYMRGFLGQFVVIIPDYELIIVRLGRKNLRNKENPDLPTKPFEIYVSEVLREYI